MAGAKPEDVVSWLARQGYPLEIRVARELRRRGFTANVGTYFRDPESDELREIDVVGSVSVSIGDNLLNIDIIVSCKVSQGAPWVALHSELTPLKVPLRSLRLTSGNADRFLRTAARDPRFATNELVRAAPAAHGIVPMRRAKNDPQQPPSPRDQKPKNTDAAYEALMSASKAAIDNLRRDKEVSEGDEGWHSITLPLVVVEGQLFDATLDDAGEPTAVESNHTRVWMRRPIGDQRGVMVDIVTASFYPAYLATVIKGYTALTHEAADEDSKLFRAIDAPRSGAG